MDENIKNKIVDLSKSDKISPTGMFFMGKPYIVPKKSLCKKISKWFSGLRYSLAEWILPGGSEIW